MLHDRHIDARVDRRIRTHRGWTSGKAVRAKPAAKIAWRRIVAWIVVVALLGMLFQVLTIHFEDNYISSVLTILSLVSVIALVRSGSGPRHASMESSHRSRR